MASGSIPTTGTTEAQLERVLRQWDTTLNQQPSRNENIRTEIRKAAAAHEGFPVNLSDRRSAVQGDANAVIAAAALDEAPRRKRYYLEARAGKTPKILHSAEAARELDAVLAKRILDIEDAPAAFMAGMQKLRDQIAGVLPVHDSAGNVLTGQAARDARAEINA